MNKSVSHETVMVILPHSTLRVPSSDGLLGFCVHCTHLPERQRRGQLGFAVGESYTAFPPESTDGMSYDALNYYDSSETLSVLGIII